MVLACENQTSSKLNKIFDPIVDIFSTPFSKVWCARARLGVYAKSSLRNAINLLKG